MSTEFIRRNKGKIAIIAVVIVAVVLIVLLSVLLTLPTGQEKADPQKPWLEFRAPRSIVPFHYEVDLKPVFSPNDFGVYLFYGSSKVFFTALKNTNMILLQSRKLDYENISLQTSEGLKLPIRRSWLYEEKDYLVLELENALHAQRNYTVVTNYNGELANDMTGFYRSEYVNATGFKKMIAASQMQTNYARETLPCYDEPEYKATFDISLWHHTDYFALSNSILETTIEEDDGWMRSKFRTTPRMSTYLLAFVVCDFEYVQAYTKGSQSIRTRVYATPEQIASGNADYAKQITPRILDYYADFFGIEYPLEKADQIAVPDFDLFTAMENWGLIIYRETRLLFNKQLNSAFNKQEVARVIAHELTHQWFGNIISPLWWDEIWLNEGFATYIQYLGMSKVEPSWKMADQFIVKDFHRAMKVDGLANSRPIVATHVDSSSQIDALFDAISYAKGACIIRMIRAFVGDEAFKLGLKNYLNNNKYGSVTHQQLFEYWEQAMKTTETGSHPPGGFVRALNTWVFQMGYPVVNVASSPENKSRVIVTQKRFLLDPTADPTQPAAPYGYSWIIPFWFASNDYSKTNLIWLDAEPAELLVHQGNPFIGNYRAFGYYRVNYDRENWEKIISQLNSNFELIDVKSRAQLIDDAFNLARVGLLDYDIPIELTYFLRKDFNYVVWKSASDNFEYLGKMLLRSKTFSKYSRYVLKLIEPSFNKYRWSRNRDHLMQLQQHLSSKIACSLGSKVCHKAAASQFKQWRNRRNPTTIFPNFRPVIYCQGVADGNTDGWEFLWETYRNETDAHEKVVLMNALTCTSNLTLANRLLKYTRNKTLIRSQDGPSVFIHLCENNLTRDETWSYIRQEWDFIQKSYGSTLFNFRKVIQSCTSSFSTARELEELESFIEINEENLGSGRKPFHQAVEQTEANIRWRALYEKKLSEFL